MMTNDAQDTLPVEGLEMRMEMANTRISGRRK